MLAIGLFGLSSLEGMSQKNKVIAHRGAWKNTGATENSIGALEHAIKLGCYGSEFDVHMSADSVLYVHHDHAIKGTHIEKTTSAGTVADQAGKRRSTANIGSLPESRCKPEKNAADP